MTLEEMLECPNDLDGVSVAVRLAFIDLTRELDDVALVDLVRCCVANLGHRLSIENAKVKPSVENEVQDMKRVMELMLSSWRPV